MAYSDYIHLFALEELYLKKKVVTSEQKNVIQAVKNLKKKQNHEAKKESLSPNCT